MADADRDSDLGDDSPVSARSEGESSGDQSCESSDEGVGRDAPTTHQPHQQHQTHQPMQTHQTLQTHPTLQPHQTLQIHQPHQTLQSHQPITSMNHHTTPSHQQINNISGTHSHQRNSPRPLEREIKVRDDFEALKSSLHPHLSSLASLAQGTPLSTTDNVFALAGTGSARSFPYTPPAFLAPAPPPPAQPAGSASSSSSEGSAAGWSFEEQYKQVRQLYEISDDPQRKEFLDDLFSFMQRRGTPINRLPIMAKSVLDLYELYNLVTARGGLVEVINKKLWQEIIKGLKLPSSITSAAFTLRTQYMKYLYEYECDKKKFSVRPELEAAIDGNRREGRRSSGQFDPQATAIALHSPRIPPATLAQLAHHMQPIPMPHGAVPTRMPIPQPPANISQHELEHRLREYLKIFQLQRDQLMPNGTESPPVAVSLNGQPPVMSAREAALNAMDISTRFTLWSMYGNQNGAHISPLPDLEPQREALNLSESPGSSTSGGKREASQCSPPPPAKRRLKSRSPPSATTPSSSSSGLAPLARTPQLFTPSPPFNGPPTSHAFNGPSTSHAYNGPSTSHSYNGPSAGHAYNTPPTLHPFNGPTTNGTNGAAFKITTRGDASTGDQQLVVSMEINGVTYEGVLFPSNGSDNGHRQMVS